MDYKELIRRLDNCGEFDGDLLDAAAEAIETLLAERDESQDKLLDIKAALDMYGGEYGITSAFQKAAERDAAVDGLRGKCTECKYGTKYPWNPPCHRCIFSGNDNCSKDYWEWRGPQKEDKHEAD